MTTFVLQEQETKSKKSEENVKKNRKNHLV